MSDLKKRRGRIVITREVLDDPNEKALRAMFLNFFPVATENNHDYNMYGAVTFYGYSPHFREVEEGELMPEYIVTFERRENGEILFKEVEEVKYKEGVKFRSLDEIKDNLMESVIKMKNTKDE